MIKKRINILIVAVLLVAAGFLRLKDLGYSDFISDEPGTFLYRGLPHKFPDRTPWEFLLDQRKGPIQVFVGYIPYFLLGTYHNEFAQRLPFALFSIFAVVVFYFAIKKLTKSTLVGVLAACLLLVNGFTAAFGRVAQYQNLNLFFSLAALYFYSFLLDSYSLKYSFLGTICFALSILSHWDAVYVLPVIIFIFAKFLSNREIKAASKVKLLVANFVLGCVVLAPFMMPYLQNYKSSQSNQDYLLSRINIRDSYANEEDIFRFKMYNPFVTYEFYTIFALLGVAFDLYFVVRKRKGAFGGFTLWFICIFLAFKFFVYYAGTHIYNVTIPVVVLCAIALASIVRIFPKRLRSVPVVGIALLFGFFYYQSYRIFVEHKVEYPWERENILGCKTFDYESLGKSIRHLIGFPHKRYWEEINDFVMSQNKLNNEEFGYFSNEDKGLSGFYMEADYRTQNGFYAVGVKRPLSFVTDYKMSNIKGKNTVYVIENEYGETVVRIYRVEDEN